MSLVDVVREKQQRLSELRAEIAQLENELREVRSLLSGRIAPPAPPKAKSRHGFTGGKRAKPIQPGSSVDWTQRVLSEADGPVHINDIIKIVRESGGPAIKKPTLVSNLSRYVKHRDTFIRTAESTYGLLGRDRPEGLFARKEA